MESESDALIDKYAKLVPKSPVETELAMSKVHISKNWKIPPRLKQGRRREVKSNTSNSERKREHQIKENRGVEYLDETQEKKKKQNRDAQRAYRERRANKIQELEGTVETLQNMVKIWQKKCKAIEEELTQSVKTVSDLRIENGRLKEEMKRIDSERSFEIVNKHRQKSKKFSSPPMQTSISDSRLLTLDPLLQNMINNFKPMKAVALRKRKSSEFSQPSMMEVSTSSASYGASSLSANSEVSTSPSSKCGFCSDSTACVCKEFELEADQNRNRSRCNTNSIISSRSSSQAETERLFTRSFNHQREAKLMDSPIPSNSNPKKRLKLNNSITTTPSATPYQESNVSGDNNDIMKINQNKGSTAFFDISDPSRPNTMDPNFKPGTCENCQKDPTSRAFCKAVYGPSSSSSVQLKQMTSNKSCSGSKTGKCGCCKDSTQNNSSTESPSETSIGTQSNDSVGGTKTAELSTGADAFQRVRHYMRLGNMYDKDAIEDTKPSSTQ